MLDIFEYNTYVPQNIQLLWDSMRQLYVKQEQQLEILLQLIRRA